AAAVGDPRTRSEPAPATRIGLPRIKWGRGRVRAIFVERQIEHAGLRAVGGRRPATAARVGRAVDRGLPDVRNRRLIDGLGAGLWIDRRHHVLVHRLLVPEPLPIGAGDRLDDAALAGCYQLLALL